MNLVGSLLETVCYGLKIWDRKLGTKHLDEWEELSLQHFELSSKPLSLRDQAQIDVIEHKLNIIARRLTREMQMGEHD